RRLGDSVTDQLSNWDAVDAEALASAVVRLDENTNDVLVDRARGRSDAALELVAHHAGATADVSLFDPAVVCVIERGVCVLRRDVLATDVVEKAVEGLAYDGQRPGVLIGGSSGDCVADDADAEGVR